jgi:Peroxidase, family 2
MIAHDGSLVHPDGEPSTAPDPTRVKNLLQQASTARNSKGNLKGGLDFFDIVRIHTEHVLSTGHPISGYHEQVSLGECGLLWEVFRDRVGTLNGVIPTSKLQQWLGEEQLPDEWWDSARPKETIGLFRARKTANEVAKLSRQIAEEAGIRKLRAISVMNC